jgi:acetyl esterase/lipase
MTRSRTVLLAFVLVCLVPAAADAQERGPEPPVGVTYSPDLIYCPIPNGKPLELDVAYPAQGDGPFPVVVILHGTVISQGRKPHVPLAFELAQRGYVAIAITFRHTAADAFPAAVDDAWAALRWVRKNARTYKIDANHIAALGFSGGGTLACLLGMTEDPQRAKGAPSSKVQAVVAYYPPTGFVQLHADCCTNKLGCFTGPFLRTNLERLLGGPPQKAKDSYAAASPVTHVSKEMAPVLLLHGTADKVVPVAQSQLLVDLAEVKGGRVTLLRLEGAAHLFDERKDRNAAMATQVRQIFLDAHLMANNVALAK